MVDAEFTHLLADSLLGGAAGGERDEVVGVRAREDEPADVVQQRGGHEVFGVEWLGHVPEPLGGAGDRLGVEP